MTASELVLTSSRERRVRRILGWSAGIALCLALAAVVTRIISIRQMRLQRTMLIHQMRLPRLTIAQNGDVTAVAVAPDGRTIFTGDDPTHDALRDHGNKPANIFVWSAANGRLLRRLPGLYWRSLGVTTSPDGGTVIANGEAYPDSPSITISHTIAWDWQTGQKRWSIDSEMPLSYSLDGRFMGSANSVFNAATGKLIRPIRFLKLIDDNGQSAFTPDGKLFGVIGSLSMNVCDIKSLYSTTRLRSWHTDTGKEAKDFPFPRVRAFDIARSGQWLVMTSDVGEVIGSTDGSVVRRVDMQSGKVLWTRERHLSGPNLDTEATLNSVAVSPNGKYVVLASINSHLIVLDAQTGRELFRPFVFPKSGDVEWALSGGLAFSADGNTLVSRCGRKTLVWDASVLQ